MKTILTASIVFALLQGPVLAGPGAHGPNGEHLDTPSGVSNASGLARLPDGRLPDRRDFARYGLRHDDRIRAWRRAMAECAGMVEDFIDFVRHPDPARLEPL